MAGAISTTTTTEIPDLNEVGNTLSCFLALLDLFSWLQVIVSEVFVCLCLVRFLSSMSSADLRIEMCPNGSSISRLIERCWRVWGSVVLFREGPVIRATVLGGKALSCLFYQGLALSCCCCGQLPFRDILTTNQLTPSQMMVPTGGEDIKLLIKHILTSSYWFESNRWPHLKWLIIEVFMGSHILIQFWYSISVLKIT